MAHKLRIAFGEDSFLLQNNNASNFDGEDENHSVTSPAALEQLRKSYFAAATNNNNNNNPSASFNNINFASSSALAASGSLTLGSASPPGSFNANASSLALRLPAHLSSAQALKGQWRGVLQNRRHVNDAKDMEFILHSISKVMMIEVPAIVDKLMKTLDDTDLFFIAMSSQELRTVLLEHDAELSHLYLLNATKRRENVTQQQQQNPNVHHHNQSKKDNHHQERERESPPPSHLLMTRDDFSAFCKPWCDAFMSMGMVHEIFIKTVQRYDEDARSVTNTTQQSQLVMTHDLFPYAIAMIAATKNPSPFMPLNVKVKLFMEKQVVPMASSVMLCHNMSKF